LNTNQLTGSIPKEIGNLTNIYNLNLGRNLLTGFIPTEISNLTKFQSLNLDGNLLTGPIPIGIGILTSLTDLNLRNNKLSGSIPIEICNLINLTKLALDYNQLTGSIPVEINNLTKLEYLYLSGNQLTGSIPAEIGNLTKLTRLSLRINQLSGSIKPEIGNLTNLYELLLRDNQLTGSIPVEIGNLTKLNHLWLTNTQLSGSVPSSINNLTNLKYLELDNNNLDELPSLNMNLLNLSIQRNHFTFEDIEPNINIPTQSFIYNPQDSIGVKRYTNLYVGEDITFTVTCGGSNNQYQWYRNNTPIPLATNNTYFKSNLNTANAGSYFCKVTNTIAPALTIYSRPIILSISTPTGFNEDEINGIKVYPNPTKGLLKIELGNETANWNSIEIYDRFGVRIIQEPLKDSFTHEIDLSEFPEGIYFLRIRNDFKSYSQKIIHN
jgi:Leucine-rich repeat (LRR) protein